MTALVLDCSVTMAWAFDDEDAPYAARIRDTMPRSEAFAPAVWPLEVCNVLLVAERRGRLTLAESARFLEVLSMLPVRVEAAGVAQTFDEVLALGRETGLSVYDASYLELAMRLGLPLATLDERSREAARQVGVGLA